MGGQCSTTASLLDDLAPIPYPLSSLFSCRSRLPSLSRPTKTFLIESSLFFVLSLTVTTDTLEKKLSTCAIVVLVSFSAAHPLAHQRNQKSLPHFAPMLQHCNSALCQRQSSIVSTGDCKVNKKKSLVEQKIDISLKGEEFNFFDWFGKDGCSVDFAAETHIFCLGIVGDTFNESECLVF